MINQRKAYIYGLLAVVCWSTVASAFKLSLRYMDPLQLLLYSCLASVVTLAIILGVQKKWRLIFAYSRSQYLQSIGLGMLNPVLYYLILFKAYDLLPAQEAQPINYTWALTLMFLSIPLLKQRIGVKEISAGILGYLGVFVISTHGDPFGLHFSSYQGVALALVSTIVWALYWIYNTKSTVDPVIGLFLNFVFGLPVIFGICSVFSSVTVANPYGLIGAAYVGVFEMGIAFVCWLLALKLSENTAKVGNLIFISPFLSLVFIHVLVGEEILPSTLVGLLFITAGLIMQQFRSTKARVQQEPKF